MNKTAIFARAGTPYDSPAASLKPVRFSKNVIGGPKSAEIRAEGSLNDLFDLLGHLAKGVEIHVDGQVAWWGFLNEVRIFDGKTQTTVSLDEMYNRIQIAYELTTAGSAISQRATTAWSEDAMSGRLYGWKELLATSRANSAAHAAVDRDRLLSGHKFPTAILEAAGGESPKASATLYCSGWWKTLGWRYANVPLLLAMQYTTIGLEDHTLGKTGGDSRIAQAFDVGPAGINAAGVEIYVRKVGSPVDNLAISIHENPDDAEPGTSLGSVNLNGALLGTSYDWKRVTFSAAVALNPNQSYFLQVARSSADASNYYEVRLDEMQGYPQGPCVTYDGDWSGHTADMPFRIYADVIVETSQQILGLLNAYGQFLSKAKVDLTSGVALESYRDGDTSALAELEHLLKMGTSGGLRYLAEVNDKLHVRVYPEPVEGAVLYSIDRDLNIYDGGDAPVEGWRAPVGVYMRSKSSAVGILNRLAGIQTTMFVEEMEYDLEQETVRITPRGALKPEDELLRMGNG